MADEKPLVGIILGSKSDLPAMDGCKEMLEKFGVPYELVIHSAHRNPDDVRAWATSAWTTNWPPTAPATPCCISLPPAN